MKARPPANKPSLDNLKNKGFEITINHYRLADIATHKGELFKRVLVADKEWRDDQKQGAINEIFLFHFGGATEMILQRGEEKYTVRADCYHKDRFCRRQGVKACLDKLRNLCDIEA